MLRSKKMRMALAVLMCAALTLGTAAQAFAAITDSHLHWDYDSPGGSPLRSYSRDAEWSNQPVVISSLYGHYYWQDEVDPDVSGDATVPASVQVDAGPVVPFTAPVKISSEGTHSVKMSAVDASGTPIAETSIFGIDLTRPVISSNVKPVYDQAAVVSISATDALSGARFIAYSLDGASDWTTRTISWTGPVDKYGDPTPIEVAANVAVGVGSHTLAYYAVDFAGNMSMRETVKFNVLASGYKPVLSNPTAKQSLNRKITFRGKVTAAATDKRVKLVIQKWSAKSKSWKAYSTIYAPAKMYRDSYAKAAYFKTGLYRVRASQGTGKSPKLVTFRVK